MFNSILIAPSLNSLLFTGILLFIIFIIFITNFNKFKRLDFFHKITILLMISIAIGSHGLVHLGVEYVYGFNPYNWL